METYTTQYKSDKNAIGPRVHDPCDVAACRVAAADVAACAVDNGTPGSNFKTGINHIISICTHHGYIILAAILICYVLLYLFKLFSIINYDKSL